MTANGRRIRKHKLKADINVVPYIDVMLVLLIIFMVTAPLMNLGVDVELPESNAKSLEQDKDPMVVQVDAAGAYALVLPGNDRPQAIGADELEARVRGIVNQNPKQAIFVAGDGSANYQKVMDAMVLLQRAGVQKVGLMSDPQHQSAR
ncbi:protein TolR [Luteimonas mephitis]|uniref:protein TolR n=1 Tax=Luteimonas mephitis TaxID=83615 RepID=UPI000478F835|nr:protein TolR [Luteimonas mephitis]